MARRSPAASAISRSRALSSRPVCARFWAKRSRWAITRVMWCATSPRVSPSSSSPCGAAAPRERTRTEMSVDRTFRSLASLSTASTSRVLNLLAITRSHGDNKEFTQNAMFSSPMLNNAIILKHRLRADEVDLMQNSRCIGTKVIIPFEKTDLRSGGRSLLVGQKGYEELLREAGHYGERYDFDRDVKVLRLLDQIPSLDPFLLREHLRTNDVCPDEHYFEISEADQKRMFEYAAAEIRRLTNLAMTPGSTKRNDGTSRLVSAL